MFDRREFFVVTAAGLGAVCSASEAGACSIVASNLTPFSDVNCRRKIAALVNLLNEAHGLSEAESSRRQDDLGFQIEPAWVDEILLDRSDPDTHREYTFVREFRLSAGTLDPRPIKLDEINLIRRLSNRATYQFTLRRYQYHPADHEGCNGLFVHDEYYGDERISCLATFHANAMKTFRRFPEWYLDD